MKFHSTKNCRDPQQSVQYPKPAATDNPGVNRRVSYRKHRMPGSLGIQRAEPKNSREKDEIITVFTKMIGEHDTQEAGADRVLGIIIVNEIP